jgi:hypothetical protein
MSNSRFSSVPAEFVSQIDVLDNRQNSPGTPPNQKKYQDWFWTDAESAEVTRIRTKADELFHITKDKSKCPRVVKVELKLLIKHFMAYDHGRNNPHHLLDKVADFGNAIDWAAARVKRGTALAKVRLKAKDTKKTQMLIPLLFLRDWDMQQHLVWACNPNNLTNKELPAGTRALLIFCYIGTEPPTSLQDYAYIGKTFRGLLLNTLTDLEPVENKKLFAWYIARYQNTLGEWGLPSKPLRAEIFFEAP